MKKSLKIALAILAAALIAGVVWIVSAPLQNKITLGRLTDDFTDEISGMGLKIIEEASTYGKLNGNGNGIQYFGCVLIENDSVEDIESVIAALKSDFETVEYWDQTTQKIETRYLVHQSLEYQTKIESGKYITICFYDSKTKGNMFDLAGH